MAVAVVVSTPAGRFNRERQVRWRAAVVVLNTDVDVTVRLHTDGDDLISVVALVGVVPIFALVVAAEEVEVVAGR